MERKPPIQQLYDNGRNNWWLVMIFLLLIGLVGCTSLIMKTREKCARSAWVNASGQSVSTQEQLVCANVAHQSEKGPITDQDELIANIESCMAEKGYERRSWWQIGDTECHR